MQLKTHQSGWEVFVQGRETDNSSLSNCRIDGIAVIVTANIFDSYCSLEEYLLTKG
jgi:hypothetical protein